MPASPTDTECEQDSMLQAANGTKIRTFGEKLIKLNLGLRRDFSWPFVVADVKYPIIGADFLAHFELSLNLHDKTVKDNVTGITLGVASAQGSSVVLSATQSGSHLNILKRYPNLTSQSNKLPPINHSYKHSIPTVGPPSFVRPRKLNPKMFL